MNLEEDILIENFIAGELSEKEHKTFLKRMDTDADFKERVLLEQELSKALDPQDWNFIKTPSTETKEYRKIYQSDAVKQLQSVIQNVNSNYQQSNKKTSKKWILYASAAVIALLISISVLYQDSSPSELYASNIADSNLPSYISREDGNENDLIKAQLLFENEEFEKSLVLFKKELKNTNTPEAGLYLYTGIAQMELNEFEDAELTFNTLVESDLLDAQKGTWFKALLYLKMGQLEKVKIVLEEIITQNSYNSKKAEKLLKKLS